MEKHMLKDNITNELKKLLKGASGSELIIELGESCTVDAPIEAHNISNVKIIGVTKGSAIKIAFPPGFEFKYPDGKEKNGAVFLFDSCRNITLKNLDIKISDEFPKIQYKLNEKNSEQRGPSILNFSNCSNIKFSKITLDADQPEDVRCGILIDATVPNTHDFSIDQCEVSRTRIYGIRTSANTMCRMANVRITNTNVHTIGPPPVATDWDNIIRRRGIYLGGVDGAVISDCQFNDIGKTNNPSVFAIYAGENCRNARIYSNNFENCATGINATHGSPIENCTFAENKFSGTKIAVRVGSTGCTGMLIRSNTIIGGQILVDYARNIDVIGNVINLANIVNVGISCFSGVEDPGSKDIHVPDDRAKLPNPATPKNISIQGNKIFNGGGSSSIGIDLRAGDGIRVTQNDIQEVQTGIRISPPLGITQYRINEVVVKENFISDIFNGSGISVDKSPVTDREKRKNEKGEEIEEYFISMNPDDMNSVDKIDIRDNVIMRPLINSLAISINVPVWENYGIKERNNRVEIAATFPAEIFATNTLSIDANYHKYSVHGSKESVQSLEGGYIGQIIDIESRNEVDIHFEHGSNLKLHDSKDVFLKNGRHILIKQNSPNVWVEVYRSIQPPESAKEESAPPSFRILARRDPEI
jgi:hypothetical protein